MPTIALPSYPDAQNTVPVSNAVAWGALLTIDTYSGSGRFVVNVNRSADAVAALLPPMDQIGMSFGEVFQAEVTDAAGTIIQPEVRFATIAELLSDPARKAAYDIVTAFLHGEALKHPKLAAGVLS